MCVRILAKGLKSKASKIRRSNRIREDKMESWNLNEMDQKKRETKKNDRNKRNPKNEMKENDMRQRRRLNNPQHTDVYE